ncbi:MAG: hypothetical protein IT438_12185 [Phycisphaerales bacterium]|nr:hypothetical protein [Phycisphaerales bacterium]
MAAAPSPPRSTPPQPILEDLFAELTWPILLSAARLALRPARVGISLMFLLGAFALLSLADLMDGSARSNTLAEHGERAVRGLSAFASASWTGRAEGASSGLLAAFVIEPWSCVRAIPFTTVLFLPALLLLTAIVGGAISRTAATELAWSKPIPWPSALAIGLSRWRSLFGALVLPLALVWVSSLLLAIAGWALFSTGVLSVLGGLFWLVFLAIGAVVALVLLGLAFGHWMLIPAVVCEGADAIDAAQHALALVFSRPLRLVLYLFILAVQGLVLGLLVLVIVSLAIGFARSCAGAWLDPSHAAIVAGSDLGKPDSSAQAAGRLAATGGGLVKVSTVVFRLGGWAVMVSYAWCAATALFLAMRRVGDGQDVGELWSSGMVGGSLSSSESSLAQPSQPSGMSEAILDNGPADDR